MLIKTDKNNIVAGPVNLQNVCIQMHACAYVHISMHIRNGWARLFCFEWIPARYGVYTRTHIHMQVHADTCTTATVLVNRPIYVHASHSYAYIYKSMDNGKTWQSTHFLQVTEWAASALSSRKHHRLLFFA